MKLEINGKAKSGKKENFNIEFFYLTDSIRKGKMHAVYYLTNEIIADFIRNLLVGSKFIRFRNCIRSAR
jgi:hypothetical protein